MNPYSFNVEMYHQKVSTSPDPRDILIPTSLPSKNGKLRSAFKFLGAIAAPKASLVVVGGILAVGCTIRVLRNRRRRLRDQRTFLRRDNANRNSRMDVGTQTESLSDLTSVEADARTQVDRNEPSAQSGRKEAVMRDEVVGKKCLSSLESEPLDDSQTSDAELSNELQRKLSFVTEASKDYELSKYHCFSRNGAATDRVQADQLQHSCCHLSAFIALLALHKSTMCGRAADTLPQTKCEKGTGESLLFSAGSRPTISAVGKQDNFVLKNTHGGKVSKVPQSRGRKETRNPGRQNDLIPREGTRHEINQAQGPTNVHRPNPFDVQVQDNASSTSGHGRKENPPLKCDFSRSEARPSSHGHGFKSNSPISRTRSSNSETQNFFKQNQEVKKAGVSRATEKPNEGKNSSLTFRSRRHKNSDDLHQRGKPRRRGTSRKNLPQRPYMDLDDPKPIASQHQRQ